VDAIPEMPTKNTNNTEKFQAYLSSYTVNGFFTSITEVMNLTDWYNETTCGTWDILLPGISDAYGSDTTVGVFG